MATSKNSSTSKAATSKDGGAKKAAPKAEAKHHDPAKKRTHKPLHEVLKKLEKHPKLAKNKGHK